MNMIVDLIGGLVSAGVQAYQISQANEAEALARLHQALMVSAERVKAELARLEDARAAADAKIADGWGGR